MYSKLKAELREFYDKLDYLAYDFNERCSKKLEENISDNMSSYKQKAVQYKIIAEMCEPVLFENSRFYYETATMGASTQGVGENSRSKIAIYHPGGWVYRKNNHKFIDQDPVLYENSRVPFYMWCGEYGDCRYHFAFNIEPVFQNGIKGLYERVESAIDDTCTAQEREYLENTLEGLLSIKQICEKFSKIAEEKLLKTDDLKERKNLRIISKAASKTPWEAPQNMYEALNTILLLHKIIGGLEGVNVTLPFKKENLKVFGDFIRTTAESGIEAFQVNCVTKEELIEARKNPEKYKDLVVRVCGYSAKFISLSDEIQEEFLTRNFYEN